MESVIKEVAESCVKEAIMTGAEYIENGESKPCKYTYLHGDLLDIEDFIEILATNNIRDFLNIKVDNEEYGIQSYKECLKIICHGHGIKFTNIFVIKVFRACQKMMCDLFISPDYEEVEIIPTYEQMMADIENLNRINYLYIKLCEITGVNPEPEAIYNYIEEDKPNKSEVNRHEIDGSKSTVFIGNEMQVQLFFESLETEAN